MNRAQKMAWFTVAVLGLALGLSVATFSVGYFILGVPAGRAAAGFGFMGIMGFLGFIPLLFRKRQSRVQCDERDLMIQRNASIAAYTTFWVLFVAAAMVPWFVTGPNGTITVNYLPWMVFGGMFVVMLVQALVTLRQYGWRVKDE
jgi:membrane protein YdbS with pleckstrin-like domain